MGRISVQITDWREYQHYSKRCPPWIKLHTKLLESADWGVLSGDAAKLLVELWLLAAKYGTDGSIETTVDKLAWRTHSDSATLATMLNSLRDNGFLTYDSAALDECLRSLVTEELPENTEELPESQSTEDESSGADTPAKDNPDDGPEPGTDAFRRPLWAVVRNDLWRQTKHRKGPPPSVKANRSDWDEGNEFSVLEQFIGGGLLEAHEAEAFLKRVPITMGWREGASLLWLNKSEHIPKVREIVGELRKDTMAPLDASSVLRRAS